MAEASMSDMGGAEVVSSVVDMVFYSVVAGSKAAVDVQV